MSATISTDKFAAYLGKATGQETSAPVLEIPGRTYPVRAYFKGDYEEKVWALQKARGARGSGGGGGNNDSDEDEEDEEEFENSPRNSRGRDSGAPASDRIDYSLVSALVGALVEGDGAQARGSRKEGDNEDNDMLAPATGAVLVFLPGVPEIDRLSRQLSGAGFGNGQGRTSGAAVTLRRAVVVFPLHGGLSPGEQKKVFAPLSNKQNALKIVLATNVAEASVTIPDVTVVIDTCRVKESDYDTAKGMTSLVTKFVSQASARQRMGRAGRVSEGRCFRLVTCGIICHTLAPTTHAHMWKLMLTRTRSRTLTLTLTLTLTRRHLY